MILLLIGLALFFIPHIYSGLRSRGDGQDLRAKLGKTTFMGLYSFIVLPGFVLMIIGYGAMRPSALLYTPPSWGTHVNMLLMLLAMPALVASQIPAGYIKVRLKHPMLVSIKLWALGHLLSNGELNSVLLFGSFLAYAAFSRICAKRRGDMGAADAIPHIKWDITAVIIGLGLYGLFVVKLHSLLIGVPVA